VLGPSAALPLEAGDGLLIGVTVAKATLPREEGEEMRLADEEEAHALWTKKAQPVATSAF
jgi:hypothetical protein